MVLDQAREFGRLSLKDAYDRLVGIFVVKASLEDMQDACCTGAFQYCVSHIVI